MGVQIGDTPGGDDVVELLALIRRGDKHANEQLFCLLYENLRRVARGVMSREPSGQTLEPTALVHEVFLRLTCGKVNWAGQHHFFAVAARAMRRVLVDRARSRKVRKATREERGRRDHVVLVQYEDRVIDMLALDDALRQLAAEDERTAHVIELRFFGGLSFPQIAKMLGVPLRTVERDWKWGRAFLYARLT